VEGTAHLAWRVERSTKSLANLFGGEVRVGSFGVERVEDPRCGRKASEGQKTKRASVANSGQLGLVDTDSREDQGFEVDEAGGTRRFYEIGSRVTGKRQHCFGKGAHSREGKQATA